MDFDSSVPKRDRERFQLVLSGLLRLQSGFTTNIMFFTAQYGFPMLFLHRLLQLRGIQDVDSA